MIFMVMILLFTSVYYSARFFLLSKNIKDVREDLREICENLDQNRRLNLSSPNKNMEDLLNEINNHIEKTQRERIRSLKREKEIRKEIESISHDLRTPLTSILGYLELMKDEDTTDEEKKEYIHIVEKKSKGLQNLIQSFYDLSRLEANEYKIEIKKIDIHKILLEQLLVFYNDFEKRELNVTINIGEEPIYIEGDFNSIDRVFVNLIQNAIKYAKSSFKVKLKEENNYVNIAFSNDVQDLKEEDVEKLFNRFYMIDSSRNNQSSGLGLTITKLLIESMGGNIKAGFKNNYIYFNVYFPIYK